MPGIGDPRAPAPNSPYRPSATQADRGAAGHSGWDIGQGPQSPWRPSKAISAKMLGPTLPLTSALPSARPSNCHTAGDSGLPPPGANPKPRSAPEGPFPNGLVPQCWELGTPEHQGRTYPAALPPTVPLGGRRSFRAEEWAGSSKPPETFDGPPGPKHLGPASGSPARSPRPAPALEAQPADQACRPPLS